MLFVTYVTFSFLIGGRINLQLDQVDESLTRREATQPAKVHLPSFAIMHCTLNNLPSLIELSIDSYFYP